MNGVPPARIPETITTFDHAGLGGSPMGIATVHISWATGPGVRRAPSPTARDNGRPL